MSVVQLQRPLPQDDIPAGLRSLADQVEQGVIEGMDTISTITVCLGHASVKPIGSGHLEHDVSYTMFAWGPRKDIFTIRGLLTTICNRL